MDFFLFLGGVGKDKEDDLILDRKRRSEKNCGKLSTESRLCSVLPSETNLMLRRGGGHQRGEAHGKNWE